MTGSSVITLHHIEDDWDVRWESEPGSLLYVSILREKADAEPAWFARVTGDEIDAERRPYAIQTVRDLAQRGIFTTLASPESRAAHIALLGFMGLVAGGIAALVLLPLLMSLEWGVVFGGVAIVGCLASTALVASVAYFARTSPLALVRQAEVAAYVTFARVMPRYRTGEVAGVMILLFLIVCILLLAESTPARDGLITWIILLTALLGGLLYWLRRGC